MSSMVPVPVANPQDYSDSWNCVKCHCKDVPQQLYVAANFNGQSNPEQLMVQCNVCGHSYYMKCADAV